MNEPSLDQIERWMQSVLMHPGGVAEAVESDEARGHIDIRLAELENVVRRSRNLDAASRLEIYVDAYYERLLECLSEEFVATRRALSDELFHALAFGYLRAYPSRSYTLNSLGANFARYLNETRLHEREIPDGAISSWGDFIVELTRFERLLRDVFDGPGSEEIEHFDFGVLADAGADWSLLRLRPAPCLRVARFAHPVHQYWSSVKDDRAPIAVVPRPTFLAINRRDYVVERHELSAVQYALLARLVDGDALVEAIGAVVESAAADASELEPALREWFAEWMQKRFFIGVLPADHSR